MIFNLYQLLPKATLLTHLSIDSTTEIPSDQLEPLLQTQTHLKNLCIALGKPGLGRTVFECAKTMTSLTSLNVDDRHGFGIYTIDLERCQELKHLDITGERHTFLLHLLS